MKRFFRENSLSLVLFAGFFLTFLVGQTLTGFHDYNDDREEHGRAPVALTEYLKSGHFAEAVFENWESEFLQMGFYVVLTVFLRQKGSAESKKIRGKEKVDEDPEKHRQDPKAPGPVRRGGIALKLYENSLGLAFLFLFLASFVGHAIGGHSLYNEERADHGQAEATLMEYMKSSRFWFESFQNWQSEFLAVGSIVVLSIFLRQKGSPESKPVHAPHEQTGTE
jgi:hypothetical protein